MYSTPGNNGREQFIGVYTVPISFPRLPGLPLKTSTVSYSASTRGCSSFGLSRNSRVWMTRPRNTVSDCLNCSASVTSRHLHADAVVDRHTIAIRMANLIVASIWSRITFALWRVEEGAGAPPAGVAHQRVVRAHYQSLDCGFVLHNRTAWPIFSPRPPSSRCAKALMKH